MREAKKMISNRNIFFLNKQGECTPVFSNEKAINYLEKHCVNIEDEDTEETGVEIFNFHDGSSVVRTGDVYDYKKNNY